MEVDEEVRTGSEEKTELTPDQEREIVTKFFAGEIDPNAKPEFSVKAPETPISAPETPTVTQTTEPAYQPPAAPAVDVESLRRENETLKQRYDNAARKISEQGQELGRYRTQPQPAPVYHQPVYVPPVPIVPNEPYDFTDPNNVAKVAQDVFTRMEQDRAAQVEENQRQQFQQNWHGTISAEKSRLSVERNLPEPVIDGAISQFTQDMASGRVPEIALTWVNLPTIIQEAEVRGAQQAMARLQSIQNQPKRAAAASSNTATVTGKDINEMSFDELREEVKTAPANSPRLNKIAALLMGLER